MKSTPKFLLAVSLSWIAFALSFASAARAHEFIIKSYPFNTQAGAEIPFSVLSSHVFMISEEMEPIQTVQVWLLEGDVKRPLALKENQILRTLDGVAPLSKDGTAMLVGHLQEPVEIVTAEGSNKSQKIKREKFCKTLITVNADDRSYKKPLGHKLEILPISDLAGVKVGGELEFQVLFDGKPLSSQIYATYDGFSRHYETYAYVTQARGGSARVKITNPGTWMVRVEKRVETTSREYDLHALKAILVFSVP